MICSVRIHRLIDFWRREDAQIGADPLLMTRPHTPEPPGIPNGANEGWRFSRW